MNAPDLSRLSLRRPHVLRASLLAAGAGVVLAVSGIAPLGTAHAAPDTAAAEMVDATDNTALRAHVNQQVMVHGTPSKTGHSKTGDVAYLNFGAAHQGVALVFFLKQNQPGRAGSEDDLKQFIGKPISVSGKLTEYKGDLQIVVESLEMVKAAP